jgi:hypothetical protein
MSGAPEAADGARALFANAGPLGAGAFEAGRRLKRHLARQGFRDDPDAFTLPDMLAVRGGNCLGLTLLLGGALLDRGHDVTFVLRVTPLDDVHAAGEEQFARLCNPDQGVHVDSRLPEARDVSARFRFVPVEHASLSLRSEHGDALPFEANGLSSPLSVDDGTWNPGAERVLRIDFEALASSVLSERAKVLVRAGGTGGDVTMLRRALRLALSAVRAWPENREAWAEVWHEASLLSTTHPGVRALGRFRALARRAAARYAAIGGEDALFCFTRYRMTGDTGHLDRALDRFPSYAEALYEKHVARPLDHPCERLDPQEAARHLAIVAWMIAESEILDLETFYRVRVQHVARLFSEDEAEELLASFRAARGAGAERRE